MKPSNGILGKMMSPLMAGIEIVALLVGVKVPGYRGSENRKTAAMQQIAFLVYGMTALEAVRCGADRAICGLCKHRGKVIDGKIVGRTCYVLLYKAITTMTKKLMGMSIREGCKPNPYGEGMLAPGQPARIGMYGDPGVFPARWLESWADIAGRWTGYTHLWKDLDSKEHGRFLMASCDNPDEYREAKEQGWRCFTTVPQGMELPKVLAGERQLACPYQVTDCETCGLCSGTEGKSAMDVVINAHGTNAKRFTWEGCGS